MNVESLFEMTDEKAVDILNGWYMGNPNIDKTKFAENFETLRLPKIKDYLEELKKSNSYLANNPAILEDVLGTISQICGSGKKKQLM